MSVIAERAPRSDRGTVRLTERDLYAFRFLADMTAIYEPDLGVLLGRFTGRQPGTEAVRKTVARWQRGGSAELGAYAKAQKLLADAPRMVMLAPAGAGLVGEVDYRPRAMWTAYHSCEVSRVRLWAEGGGGPFTGGRAVTEWQSELEFRAEQWRLDPRNGTKGLHVPDGLVTLADGRQAVIEVERTDKTTRRLAGIMARLSVWPLVIYLSHERRIQTHVKTVYEAADPMRRPKQLLVLDYPTDLTGEGTTDE